MAAKSERVSPVRRAARAVLVVGYLAVVVLGFGWEWQPRLFWTVALPLLVLFIVLAGFHLWRTICPLAFFGEVGRRLNRGAQRKAPAWLASRYMLASFVFLASMLTLRLLATNGDRLWLTGLLVGLALAAMTTNALFTGKTWCNFVCPVGFVERLYTDTSGLGAAGNSQCARCTACKKSCPDIDQENNYWRELSDGGRRAAGYAFPGLVLAFYGYFWLRHGDWEAYFDGRWTRIPADAALALGPGFFFAPEVPALVAAALTVVLLSLVSYGLWRAVEAGVGRWVTDEERRRHLVLSLAVFSAFSLFYVFAGAPTLRRIPYGTRVFAFIAPAIATLVLVRRWRRSRELYVRERGAAKLLRNWPFDEPPPSDPAEAYALVKATEQAREKVLHGYTQTLREILADGIVRGGERRLFDEIRKQFGITPREHEQVVERLEEEERELLEGAGEGGAEERAQLEGYQAALAEALLRRASAREIADLRMAFGVEEAAHDALLKRLRGGSGLLVDRARRHLDEATELRSDRETIAAGGDSEGRQLLAYLLAGAERRSIERALDVIETAGDADQVRALRPALLCDEAASRAAGLRQLVEACPGAETVTALLERLLLDGSGSATGAGDEAAVIERLAASNDRYVRAATLWVTTERPDEERIRALERAASDPDELVGVTAAAFSARARDAVAPSYVERSPIERMQFLRRVPLLADLDASDLEELGAFAREETIEPPATLCRQDVPDTGDLFVILEGLASVSVRSRPEEPGSGREVAELGVNEVVGELSLLDGSPRSATVGPKGGALRVLRIPGPTFRARLLHRQRVARSLMLTLTQRLRGLAGKIAAAGG